MTEKFQEKSGDEGGEIILVSRRKKKVKSATIYMKGTYRMVIMLLVSIGQVFFDVSRFSTQLEAYITMRKFRWVMVNLELGGYYYDGIFKTGILDPSYEYLNMPALATAKFGFNQTVTFLTNSTNVALRTFDKNSDIEAIYERSFSSNYCQLYEEIKKEHFEGREKYPCSSVFENLKDYVS